MSAIITAPIRCKRPVVAKKKAPRCIGDDVFRIIVEMAYEMEKADKIQNEINAVDGKVEELFEMLVDERKTKNLRSFTPTRQTFGCSERDGRMYIPSIKCRGFEYPLYGTIEYERFIPHNGNGKIHERGVIRLSVRKIHSLGGDRLSRATYSTVAYDTAEQYITVKQEIKEIFIDVIKYTLWG